MVKRTIFIASLAMISCMTYAQKKHKVVVKDSIRMVMLQNVQVTSTRAGKKTPIAFSNLTKQEIERNNTGVDIPFLLSLTPSVTTSSDAGTGVGYTGIHVRGIDPTRINITANGIPVNDAESSQLYWVDMGDFASSVDNIQIQRGVGTSTNGAGAFGASINMQTQSPSLESYATLNAAGGSYDTHKESLIFGSGLINNHWSFDGRLSNIGSNGYIDRASTRLNSYFFQGGYYGENTSVKFVTFNGNEKTYHAWNYATQEEIDKYGRTYNSCGKYIDQNGHTAYYKNQTDLYHQQTYQLIWNQLLSSDLNFNLALHYTHGRGYYEEYKNNASLPAYGLHSIVGNDTTDLVRRKEMRNDFYGTVFSINYKKNRVDASFGGGWNKYEGEHFGDIVWIRNYFGKVDPDQYYYDDKAKKTDGNIYAKAKYDLIKGLNAYVDLQYRHINYKLQNPADKYIANRSTDYLYNNNFDFFNPKFGLYYQADKHNILYASFAMSHKEPTRNDYEDLKDDAPRPKAERLNDWEAGYKYESPTFTASAGLYYMKYKNQFVLTGEVNAIGEQLVKNVGSSYREGIELSAAWKPCRLFRWDANATFSKNRVKDWEVISDNGKSINLGTTHVSYSPSTIFNNIFTLTYHGFEANLQSQYVGEQYMTNTDSRNCMLDAYFVSNLNLSYTFKIKYMKSITLGAIVYNIFDEKYETNGFAENGFDDNGNESWNYAAYSVQAPIHFMVSASLNF